MAATDLTTYAGLQAAIADWLERGDLNDRIPAFITLGESRMNRLLTLREVESDNALTGVPGSRFIPLPSGYSEPQNLWLVWTWGKEPLRFVPPELLQTLTAPTYPQFWTIDGDNIAFERPLGGAYSFIFRMIGKVALSNSQPSNAILANYPDAYLFSALAEAYAFLRDSDGEQNFQRKLEVAINEINSQERRSKALTTLSTEFPQIIGRNNRFNIIRGD